VTESQHLAALGAIRSFGRAGHTVTAAYSVAQRPPPAVSSRYSAGSQAHPDPWQQHSAFRQWLVDATAGEAFDVLLPISEAAIVASSAVKAELPPSLTVLAASAADQAISLSKFCATRRAQESGLIIPETIFLDHTDSWRNSELDLNSLNYPLVLKSDNHFSADGVYCAGTVVICEDPVAFERQLESSRRSPARFIAQEFIQGRGEGAFLLKFNGETRLQFAHRRLHEPGAGGGVSSLRESSGCTSLIRDADRMLSACGFEGLAMVEFRRGSDGKPYFLEVNGRLWGSMALALHSGIDFPRAWLELVMCGQTDVIQMDYASGLRCCSVFPGEINYLRSRKVDLGQKKSRRSRPARAWLEFLNSVFNPLLRHDQFWWTDPVPGLSAARQFTAVETRRIWHSGIERLKRKSYEKKGPLQLAAALAYKAWNRSLVIKHRLYSSYHSRKIAHVSEGLRDADRILFLCYGNICRSPFAAAYWNDRLSRLGVEGPVAISAGYHPEAGRTTPGNHKKIVRRFGLDLEAHRSSVVTEKMIHEADIVFIMDADNRAEVDRRFPQARSKMYYLGLFSGDSKTCIPDPYNLPLEQQLEAYRLIQSALGMALNTLAVHRGKPSHPLRIFMFHSIVSRPLGIQHYCFLEEGLFKQQLELIKHNFRVLPLSEATRKMQAGEITEPTAVITFDDGFLDNYTIVFPELKRLNIPATVFVSTGFTDSDQTPWFCRILRACSETTMNGLHWNGTHHDLSGETAKSNTAAALMAELKHLAQDLLESATDDVERLLGFEARRPVDSGSPYRMLTSRAIKEMAESGLVEFGGHTHSHAILSRLSSSEQQREIRSSLDALSAILGRPCTVFAYPNGLASDYDTESVGSLLQAGVTIALTTVPGANQWYENSLEQRREAVGPPDRSWVLESRIRSMIENDAPAAGLKN